MRGPLDVDTARTPEYGLLRAGKLSTRSKIILRLIIRISHKNDQYTITCLLNDN